MLFEYSYILSITKESINLYNILREAQLSNGNIYIFFKIRIGLKILSSIYISSFISFSEFPSRNKFIELVYSSITTSSS